MEGAAQAALVTLAGVLTVAAITSVLHGSSVNAIGDRVACGLLALPLIGLLARDAAENFPAALWLAPAPLAVYIVLLALSEPSTTNETEPSATKKTKGTLDPIRSWVRDRFTVTLIVLVGLVYATAWFLMPEATIE